MKLTYSSATISSLELLSDILCGCISSRRADIIRRVNVLISYFGAMNIDTKYKLFNIFCINVYGSVLWDYSSHHVNSFYTAWRNSIRRLFRLPMRSHCSLLHHICGDISAEGKLHVRFLKLIRSCLLSNNLCTNLCAKLALQGSRSDTAKSINFICSKYGIIKYDIVKSHHNEYLHVVNDFVVEFMSERAQLAGLLYDILCTRDDIYYNNYNLFSLDEVQIMIDHVCMN